MLVGPSFSITELQFSYGYATLSAAYFFQCVLAESLSFNTLMGPLMVLRLDALSVV